jgi:spermidine synthase
MYAHYFPDSQVDGVEIDPELTEIGEKYFDLGAPNIHTYAGDARPWLRQSDGDYDVIVVDAYRQPYIPFYLATKEFFDLVAEKLAPGGVVVVNVGHPEGNDDLEKVIGRTMAESFGYVTRDPIESANTLMLGSQTEASPEHMLSEINVMPDDVSNIAVASSNRIGPRLPGGEVYTDDRAPVEWLIDRSILGYAGAN